MKTYELLKRLMLVLCFTFSACDYSNETSSSQNSTAQHEINTNTTFLINGETIDYVKVKTNGKDFMYEFSFWNNVVYDKFNSITSPTIEIEIIFDTMPDNIRSIGKGYYVTYLQNDNFIISEKEATSIEWMANSLNITANINSEEVNIKSIIFGFNIDWYGPEYNSIIGNQYYIGFSHD